MINLLRRKVFFAGAASLLLTFFMFFVVNSIAEAGNTKESLVKRFNDATISAGPGTYEALGRSVLHGGYVRTRFEVKPAPQIVKIKGPGISGGCNGFDLYGGSFSYISGDEIIEWLRAVAENAGALATYMFLTFLQESCSVCSEVMQTLYAMQDLINSTMGGSCETATMMVEGIKTRGENPEWKQYKEQVSQNLSRVGTHASGAYNEAKDALASKKEAQESPKDAADARYVNAEDKAREYHNGNMLYWLIYSNGDDNFLNQFKGVAGNNIDKEKLYTYLTYYVGNRIRYMGDDSEPNFQGVPSTITIKRLLANDYEEDNVVSGNCNGAFSASNDFCFKPTDTTFCHYIGGDCTISSIKDHFSCLMTGLNEDGTDCGEKGLLNVLGTVDNPNPTSSLAEGSPLMVFLTSKFPGSKNTVGNELVKWQTDPDVLFDYFQCNQSNLEVAFARSQILHAIETTEGALDSVEKVPTEYKALYRAQLNRQKDALNSEFSLMMREIDREECSKYQKNSFYDDAIRNRRPR